MLVPVEEPKRPARSASRVRPAIASMEPARKRGRGSIAASVGPAVSPKGRGISVDITPARERKKPLGPKEKVGPLEPSLVQQLQGDLVKSRGRGSRAAPYAKRSTTVPPRARAVA